MGVTTQSNEVTRNHVMGKISKGGYAHRDERIQSQEPADCLAIKQANQHAGTTNMASHDGNPTRMIQKRWERLGKRWECK